MAIDLSIGHQVSCHEGEGCGSTGPVCTTEAGSIAMWNEHAAVAKAAKELVG